jgi:hypothetical protein
MTALPTVPAMAAWCSSWLGIAAGAAACPWSIIALLKLRSGFVTMLHRSHLGSPADCFACGRQDCVGGEHDNAAAFILPKTPCSDHIISLMHGSHVAQQRVNAWRCVALNGCTIADEKDGSRSFQHLGEQ